MLKKVIEILFGKKHSDLYCEYRRELFDEYGVKSYSQEGEDMILKRIFEGVKNGFYVDIGAHHPKRFSNTYYFYKKGWRGVNVDAMPKSMDAFRRARPQDINVEKAISEKKEKLTYYLFNEPALNGFSKVLTEKRARLNHYDVIDELILETGTLECVLDEYLPVNQVIDFLSIDVEGLDYSVLKSNCFKKYRPKVILVEVLNFSLDHMDKNEVFRLLESSGYCFFSKCVNTIIFMEASFWQIKMKQPRI